MIGVVFRQVGLQVQDVLYQVLVGSLHEPFFELFTLCLHVI